MSYESIKIFLGISFVIYSLGLMTGCSDDFLDRPPLGTMDDATWINTEDAGAKMLSMCYTPMMANAEYQMFKFEFLTVLLMICIKVDRMRQIKFELLKSQEEILCLQRYY